MFRLFALVPALVFATVVTAPAATLAEQAPLSVAAQPEPGPDAFPVLLDAWRAAYPAFSPPTHPGAVWVALHLLLLVGLCLAIARALPHRRRSWAGRRAQAARAAVEMSRMR